MMRMMSAVAGGVVVVGLGVTWAITGGVFNTSDDPFAKCRTSAIAGGTAQIGGPFTLVNGAGETVTDKDVITEPSLVYFGYTFCPDVCPLDMARNAEAVDLLQEQGKSVTPVFITIDPQRDTPEIAAEFASIIHPKGIGLSGSKEQIDAASKAYRTYYKINDSGDDLYLIDHSVFSYLVLPKHGFVEFFSQSTSPEKLAQTAACFIDKA